jgi:hypothetical protein
MVLELGPCPAEDVVRWSKFARRIVVELRSTEGIEGFAPDVIDLWARTLDDWSSQAKDFSDADSLFRLTEELEPEVAEYLLHGLDRCLHSPAVMSWITPEEAKEQRAFTMHVVRAFVDCLSAEGYGCQQYADQILSSFGALLDDSNQN